MSSIARVTYIELDPGVGGGGVRGWLATIAALKGATGVKGVVLVLPWVSELRIRDETGVWTPVQLFHYAMSGGIATGGQMQSNYFIWSLGTAGQGPKAFTNAQILEFIASINGAVNFTKPSTYR